MDQLVIDAARVRLEQLRCEERQLESAIRAAEHRIASKNADRSPNITGGRRKSTGGRNMGPEARQRIADAQKKRWANFRKEKAA